MSTTKDDANELKEFFKQWPRFYYSVFDFFGPVYFGGLSPKNFLKKFPFEGDCYNLGAGARRISPEMRTIDIASYPSVDIVADISNLPLKDASVARIVCDQVLEHVEYPKKVAQEIYRVLQIGGYAYISLPFMYPFHASPSDFRRYTHVGLPAIFSEMEVVEVGVRSGPFSALTTYLCYLFASVFSFGSERLYWFLVLASTFIFFPLKFLDVIGNRLPFAINVASVLYCVVRKK